jgi:hypothetical protein
LTTRASRLGIAADVVVLYDSDWYVSDLIMAAVLMTII